MVLSILLAVPSKAAKGWYYDEHEDPKPGDPFAADGFGYEKDGMGCIGFGCAVAGGAIPDIPDIPAFKAAPSPPVMSRECPYIDEGRSSAWPGNVQVTAVFPGWRKGATATIRLGGSVYGIQQCWNTEGSPRVSGGALSFQLGGGTPGLDGQSVGCILDGDMAGNAAPTNELEIEYDVECDRPSPPPPLVLAPCAALGHDVRFQIIDSWKNGLEARVSLSEWWPGHRVALDFKSGELGAGCEVQGARRRQGGRRAAAGGDEVAADDVDAPPRRLERRPQTAERRVPGGNEGGGATGTASRPLAT